MILSQKCCYNDCMSKRISTVDILRRMLYEDEEFRKDADQFRITHLNALVGRTVKVLDKTLFKALDEIRGGLQTPISHPSFDIFIHELADKYGVTDETIRLCLLQKQEFYQLMSGKEPAIVRDVENNQILLVIGLKTTEADVRRVWGDVSKVQAKMRGDVIIKEKSKTNHKNKYVIKRSRSVDNVKLLYKIHILRNRSKRPMSFKKIVEDHKKIEELKDIKIPNRLLDYKKLEKHYKKHTKGF